MRKLSPLLLAALMVVLLATSAVAGNYNYKVRKGETLSQIAKEQDVPGGWKNLYNFNKILIGPNPNIVRVGVVLKIPSTSDSKPLLPKPKEVFLWKHPGDNKFQGTLEQALQLLGVEDATVGKTSKNQYIRRDDRFLRMVFGKKQVRRNVIADWSEERRILAAEVFDLTTKDGRIWELWRPIICGNWALRKKEPEAPKVSAPVKISIPAPEVNKREEKRLPEIHILEDEKCVIEHEPIIGAWYGRNELSGWWGFYTEYTAYIRHPNGFGGFQLGWAPGIGFFGIYSEGESFQFDYSWKEYGLGPQLALKYIQEDWQWEAKIRPIYEWTAGNNSTSGYWVKQRGFKLGVYTEGVIRLDDEGKLKGIATAEAWFPIGQSVESSWIGQEVQNRFQASFRLGLQYQLTDDMSLRVLGGVVHQGWDHRTGIQVLPELRWKLGYDEDVLMIAIPLTAFSPAEFFTYGIGIRIEGGPIFREIDRERRMAEINLKYNPFAIKNISDSETASDDNAIGAKKSFDAPSRQNGEWVVSAVPSSSYGARINTASPKVEDIDEWGLNS